ncbi:MAG: DNRLRE domain-containing protein, partial [Desulfobaccales bacterium]
MRHIRLKIFVLALIVLSFGTAWADTITLNPVDDVYWTSTTSTTPIDSTVLLLGGGTSYNRFAMKFDLTAIPDGSTITSATLNIYQSSYSTASSTIAALLKYSADDNWSDSAIPAGGPAATVQIGGNRSLTNPAAPRLRSWDLLTAVNPWNPIPDLDDNFLSLRVDQTNPSVRSLSQFYSSSNTTNKPYLLVDYTPPAHVPGPATILLLGTG